MKCCGYFLGVLAFIFGLNQTGAAQFARLPIYRLPPTLTKSDKELIAINSADKIKFADFLKQDETGFLRLHDAADCGGKSNVVNAAKQCPWNVTGRAISYSFRKENYRSAFFSDIALVKSKFHIVGFNMLGFLTELGDVALDDLSLQSKGVKEMYEFAPSDNLKEIEKQYAITEKGFRIGDFLYTNSLPVKENIAYALRCIAYRGKIYRRVNGFKINVLDSDKRTDVTLVFRVIRKHDDGSVSILWKQLNERESPKIVFEEALKK